jgi:hypothetical protein
MKFTELSEKSKKYYLNKYSDINVEDSWWYECVWENFCANMQKKGIHLDEKSLSFELYGQGSGTSFEGSIDWKSFVDISDRAYPIFDDVNPSIEIKRNHHCYKLSVEPCPRDEDYLVLPDEDDDSVRATLIRSQFKDEEDLVDHLQSLFDYATEEVNRYAKELYNELEEENSFLSSEESIIDTFINNEMEFEELYGGEENE